MKQCGLIQVILNLSTTLFYNHSQKLFMLPTNKSFPKRIVLVWCLRQTYSKTDFYFINDVFRLYKVKGTYITVLNELLVFTQKEAITKHVELHEDGAVYFTITFGDSDAISKANKYKTLVYLELLVPTFTVPDPYIHL